MSEVVESQQLPDDPQFFLGAEHCTQEGEVDIYKLEQITLQELNSLVPMGDARGITKKAKKSKRHRRKSRKHTRKSRKHK